MENAQDTTPVQRKPDQPVKRRFYALIAIALVASTFGLIQNTANLFSENKSWQFYLNYAFSFIGMTITIWALILVRKGRVAKAGGLLISYAIINGLLAAFIFTGLGLLMQMIITMAGVIISLEMMTGRARTIWILAAIVAGAIAFGTDLLPLNWRTQSLSPTYNLILSICILLFVGVYVLYNFKSYSLQMRLIFTFLGVNLLAVILIAAASFFLTQTTLISDSSRKLLSTAKSLSNELQVFIDFNLYEVHVQAGAPTLTRYLTLSPDLRSGSLAESQANKLLMDWKAQNPTFIESYGILNRTGINVLDTDVKDIGLDESQASYFLEPVTSGLPYSSPVMFSDIGNRVWFISAPIYDDNRNIIGILRLRYRADILQSILEPYNDLGGDGSFGVLMDEYNVVLAHGINPDVAPWVLIGLPEAEVRQLQATKRLGNIIKWLDLPDFRDALAEARPNQIIKSAMPLTGIDRPGYGALVNLNNQSWKVFYFRPQDTILLPVQGQTRLVILFAEIAALVVISLGNLATRVFTNPIQRVTRAAEEYSRGNFKAKSIVRSRDEIGSLAATLNDMSGKMDAILQDLDNRVNERTRSIKVSAEIGRQLSSVLKTDDLVKEVVNQIKAAFNYYHVQIYLMDSGRQNLVLVSGTGSVGQQMVSQGHSIPLGRGLVGRAAIRGAYVLISNTSMETNWLSNPLLPETRSELAVPLLFGEQVLGVLDVQQDQANGLDERDADTLQVIAGQVAIAIRNSRLLEELQQRADQQTQLTQIMDEITRTMNIEKALKVAVREVGRATGGPSISIRYKNRITGNN